MPGVPDDLGDHDISGSRLRLRGDDRAQQALLLHRAHRFDRQAGPAAGKAGLALTGVSQMPCCLMSGTLLK